MTLPEDIKKEWYDPIRRLQATASQNRGLAIIRIRFVVNENGVPVCWSEPEMTKIERKRDAGKILDMLTE
jgi:hypothetical protein